MGRRYLTLFFAAFALFVHPAPAAAWGNQGRRMIADIAMDHLSHAARENLKELLAENDLASISTWADDIKNDRSETRAWHYVDIPATADGYLAARDCPEAIVSSPRSISLPPFSLTHTSRSRIA